MAVTTDMIRALRGNRGRRVDCKRASTRPTVMAAAEILRRRACRSGEKTERRLRRRTSRTYTREPAGLLVEVSCETDFVARTEDFISLTSWLCSGCRRAGYRATTPRSSRRKAAYAAEMAGQNKPPAVMERIVEGKLGKFYEENCLLEQAYIRDPERKIQDLITAAIAKLGENVVVRRFCRFQIGAVEEE